MRTLVFAAAGLGIALGVRPAMAQDIHLAVTPKDAVCEAHFQAWPIGSYDVATGTLHVPVSERTLRIKCHAPGYRDTAGWLPGNGDIRTGMPYRYPKEIVIALAPL